MKHVYLIRQVCGLTVGMLLLCMNVNAQTAHGPEEAPHFSEELWESIDFTGIRKKIVQSTGMSAADIDLYMKYLYQRFPDERPDFFRQAQSGSLNAANIAAYTDSLTARYISCYADFLTVKTVFTLQQETTTNQPLSINGPCVNVDFEDGTTNGWTGSTGTACRNPTPCTTVNGFNATRHVIMDNTMTDPYIPTLPVVAPGGNYSLRLENYRNGGNASMVRQTFLVTPTNNIFTYQYAAVLEDPGDHDDNERPYFKVRMYDKNGGEITCATYTAIAKPPIQNFTLEQVPNPNFNPSQPAGPNNPALLDLYYRNWTTITIPLLAYVGQNVTVEFIASDCSRGGHLGYAYVDASCSYLDTYIPPTICGPTDVTLYGPNNFAGYLWNGPGIVGARNTQNITVNKSGTYTLRLTPVADNPCPVTVSTVVPERCLPVPIAAALCETVKGTGIAKAVDLTKYNTPITAYNALARVASWHSAKPATAANRITAPAAIDVSNGKRYYAVIQYTTAGSDTAEIRFTVNSIPVVQFPAISPACTGDASFNITGVTPSGGVFSGQNVTASGVFTPSVSGTFPIKYKVTSAAGCKDSVTVPVVVNPPPTVNAGPDQKLCSTASTVALSGTATNAKTIKWSNGAGTFSDDAALQTVYTPTAAEISAGGVTLRLTITGTAPCSPVSDQVFIQFVAAPTVNAGPNQKLCSTVTTVSLAGTTGSSSGISWTGGSGTFSPAASASAVYTPTAAEISAGTLTLTLNITGNSPCAKVSDPLTITFVPPPTADAGTDQKLCASATSVSLNGTSAQSASTVWSGGSGIFSSGNTLASLYTPTPAEIASGQVTLTLKAVANAPCADRSDALTILFVPEPVVHAGADQDLCMNAASSVSLSGSSIQSSATVWSGGVGSFSSTGSLSTVYQPSAAELAAGSVVLQLKATGNTPCVPVTDNVTIRFHKLPVVDAGPDQTVCKGTAVSVSAQNIAGLTYQWKDGQGTAVSSSNAFTINADRDSTLTVTVTDAKGCKGSDALRIIAFSPPVFNLGGPFCFSEQLLLDADPTIVQSVPASPVWFKDGTLLNGQNAFTLTVTQAGTYTVSFTYGTCVTSASSIVYKNPVLITPDEYIQCEGTNATIITSSIAGGVYVWDNNGTPLAGHSNSITVPVISGKHKYHVQVTDPNHCTAKDSVYITGALLPVVSLRDTGICQNKFVQIDAHPVNSSAMGNVPVTYQWTKDNTPLPFSGPVYQTGIAGTYSVKAAAGDCFSSSSMKLTIYALPEPDLPAQIKFCPESDKQVVLDAGATGNYVWEPGGETTSSIIVSQGGLYAVTVTNALNCSAYAKTEVREVCPPRLFVGNAFSPNADGTNDLFNVYGVHIGTYKLLIFNRWGEIIFESTNKDYFWDGFYRGELMPIGVYPWIITYEGDTPEFKGPYKLEGSVTIVK